MKKALLALLVLAMVAAPAFAQFKVGLVTDVGGIDDKSFNQGTWEGIVRFAQDNKLPKANYKYLQSSAEADYVPNLSTFADEGLNLIIAPGFLFEKAMTQVATNYPTRKFLIIDSVVNLPNVASAVFAEHEGSFLVGVAAGLKAKADGKNIVGFIGGMQFPLIEKFQAGFEQGVKAVDPSLTILVDYAGDFAAPDKGQAIAQKQFNAGAYIIFHAAGGTGNGMIKEAKERSQKGDIRWGIGVDKDQYSDGVYGSKSAVLTSMMKRVDVAAYEVSKMTMQGKFPGGQVMVFSLANDGVGIPDNNPNLSNDIVAKVKEYAAKIKSGALKVSEVPAK
ncbi:Membrane lipoprotein TmpC [uncultured Spirochaetota bacterium]|uniref:Membrane lipoprotein TmpC n=1 Tax=uncultured Spirochaetota bacterium TaxID=460511 RepID=A0A652ZX18_9SPIR|nr:Membrane lipoprotein TmpC [uncultured Spirochaetota bacterium]